MDIISVTQSKLKSILEEATFELNSCLEQPTASGSLDGFSKAIQKYSCTLLQLENLFKLQQQIDQANVTEETKQEENET